MYEVAKRAAQKKLLEEFIEKRERMRALRQQLKTLEAETAPVASKLQSLFPQGVALDTGGGAAKIVEFVETDRQTVDIQEVRRMLGAKTPTSTVPVTRIQIYDGEIC